MKTFSKLYAARKAGVPSWVYENQRTATPDQVRTWRRALERDGLDGLLDRRGRPQASSAIGSDIELRNLIAAEVGARGGHLAVHCEKGGGLDDVIRLRLGRDIPIRTLQRYPRLQDQSYWVCMRSFGEGLPVIGDNFSVSAIRIKANDQLSGQIQNLNGIVDAMVPKWDSETKEFGDYGTGSNPGEQINWLARCPQNPKPLEGRVDLSNRAPGIGAFAEVCAENDWKCDYILDGDMSVEQALQLVGSSGKALGIGFMDGLLSVPIDNEREAPAQVFSGRNVKNFTGTISFTEKLQAVKVSFFDAASGFQQESRTVYADGFDENTVTDRIEGIEAPTKTDAKEVFVEGWRYLNAPKHRPEIYEFDCDLPGLVVPWGGRADIAHSRMATGICGTRIRSLITRGGDGYITGFVIDEIVPMEAGVGYVLKAQRGTTTGLLNIVTVPGETDTLMLDLAVPPNQAPVPGNHCVLGVEGKETLAAIVIGKATREDKTSHLTCIPYAPELLADGGTIPPWDPKVTPRAMATGVATCHVSDVVRRATDDEVARLVLTGYQPEGSVPLDSLTAELAELVDPSLNGVRDMQSAVADLEQASDDAALDHIEAVFGSAADKQELRERLQAKANALTASVNEQLTAISNQTDALALAQTNLTVSLAGKADGSALTTALTRITTSEGNITILSGQQATFTASLSGKADASALTATTTRVTTAEGNISVLSGQQATITASLSGKADASALASTQAQVTGQGSTLGALSAQYTSLSTTVGSNTTSISQALQSINGIAARWGVVINSDGVITGAVRLDGGAGGSSFDVLSDAFRVWQPGGAVPVFAIESNQAVFNVPVKAQSITTTNIVYDAVTDVLDYEMLTPTYSGATNHESNTSPWKVATRDGSDLYTVNSFKIHQGDVQAFLPAAASLLNGIPTNGYDCVVFFEGVWRSTTSSLTHIWPAVMAGYTGSGASTYLQSSTAKHGMTNTDTGNRFTAKVRVPAGYSAFWPVVFAQDHDVWIDNASIVVIRRKR